VEASSRKESLEPPFLFSWTCDRAICVAPTGSIVVAELKAMSEVTCEGRDGGKV